MTHFGLGARLRWTAAGLLLVHAATALAWDTVATAAVDVGTSDFLPTLTSEADANGFWAYGWITAPSYSFGHVQTALIHYADADHVVAVTPVADPTLGTYGSPPYAWSLTAMPDGGVLATFVGSNIDSPQFYGWSCYLQRYDAQGALRWTTVTGGGGGGVGLEITYCPTPTVDQQGSVWITLGDSTQLTRLAPDGSAAAQIELGSRPFGSQPDEAGGVYVIADGYFAHYGADASLQWRVDATALSTATRLLIDAGGNLDVIGLGSATLITHNYTPAGVLRWTTSIPAPASHYIADATASPDGKIYVSVVGGDTNSSAQLIAIGADGTPAWPAPFVTQTGADCLGPFAARVRTAANGDVLYLYAAASFCDGHTSLFRFRPDGTPVYTFPLGTSGYDYAEAVPGTLADGSTLLAAAGKYTRISAGGAALAPPATADIVATTPTIDAQLALDDGGSYVLASDQDANHHAFARFGADGTRLWQQTGEYFWRSARIVTNGARVCVGGSVTTGSAAGDIGITIRCFTATDGAPVWAWSGTGAPISALRVLADGRVVALRAGGHLLIDASGAVVHDIALPALADVGAVDINAAGRAVASTSVTVLNLVAIDSDGSTAYAMPSIDTIVVPAPFALSASDDGTAVVAYIGRSAAGTGLHALRVNAQGAKLWKTFLHADNSDYYPRPIAASITQSGQAVYIAAIDASPSAAAVDLDSGVATWSVPFAPLHPAAPALEISSFSTLLKNPAGPQLLLLNDAGNKVRLTTFDTATGAIRRDRLEACADSPCVSASAVLGSDGALHLASSPTTGVGAARPRIYTSAHPFATPAPVGIGQPGLDGAWFPTYAGGQGFTFDYIAGASTVFMPWFTFTQSGINDPAGLAWYTLQGGGVTPGTTYAELAIAIPDPGLFNSGAVAGRRVGTAHLSFSDCSSGTLWYQFDADTNDGAGGLITLTRLTPSTDPCSLADGGTAPAQNANPPDRGFDSHQSGSWFDPATSGQGMQLTIIPAGNGTAGFVFAAWFTFDPTGQSDDPMNQHWFTLQGDLSTAAGGKVTLPIYRIIGGAFDSTPTSNYSAVGHATLTMLACDSAQLDYQFDSTAVAHAFAGLSGSMHLAKIGGCMQH